MTTPTDFLRIALDPLRLAILGRAAVDSVDIAAMSDALGIAESKVQAQVAKLVEAGLLDRELRLDRHVLRRIASDLPTVEPVAQSITSGDWSAGEIDVLGRYFEGSRLRSIPSHRSKRVVVLERLAQEFEPGLRYAERDVDLSLQLFHPDYAALRRYLVDEGLLTRADGVYWRTGGRA